MSDPTINESHPLYWHRKFDAKVQECADLQARLDESERHRTKNRETAVGLQARLEAAERDAERLQYLANNPLGGQVTTNDGTVDVVFWGISAHPKATLREAIDAARGGVNG